MILDLDKELKYGDININFKCKRRKNYTNNI